MQKYVGYEENNSRLNASYKSLNGGNRSGLSSVLYKTKAHHNQEVPKQIPKEITI